MKNKNNKNTIPAYAFGMDQLPNYLGGANVLGSAISGLSGEGSTGDAIGSTLGEAASLGATGFSIGGPIGAAVGGGLGLVTGIVGAVKRRKQLQELKRRKQTLNKTKLGIDTAAATEGEYWDDNTLAYTFENGGILPDLAYLDNNEIIRDTSGNIVQVPNTKPGTDNHLVDASTLESVLSDKIKRPGTKHTFAKEGQILSKMTKPSKGKDIFAENTNRLNKINANKAYEKLLAEQEAVKAAKGVKPKVKGIPAYEDGKGKYTSVLSDLPTFWNTIYDKNISRTSTTPELNFLNRQTPAGRLSWLPLPGSYKTSPTITAVNATVPTTKTPNTPTKPTTTPKYNFVDPPMVNVEEPLIPFNDAYTQPLEIKNPTVAKPDLSPISEKIGNKKGPKDKIPTNSYTPDWLSLAPTVYNALQSLRGPENEPLVLNPYADAIRSTMARRRMNVEPARLANSRTRAISNYNLANINANTGANLAARTQAAVGELASNADMYATKQNADNAYLGEYANVLNNLGQQFVQSQNMYNDLNARNRAAARNFGANAASQLGKWSQVRRQEQNQYNRDQLIMPFLADFLNQGYTKDQVNYLLARTRNKF